MMALLCPCIGSYDIKKLRYRFYTSFRITVKEIRFKRNDYFLKNSHYNFYIKKNWNSKIKGTTEVTKINELSRLPVDDTLRLYSSLYQSIQGKYTNRYKPLVRRLMVRQITKISAYDEIFKDIGYIELPLHELIKLEEPRDFVFPIIDDDNGLEATLHVVIERKLKNDPYAGSFLYRTGKYISHEVYIMMFPPETISVPSRLDVNQGFFDQLRQRDTSEYRAQILEDDEQLALRREFERQRAERARKALESEINESTSKSTPSSPSKKDKRKLQQKTSDDDLQILQFSEDDFDDAHVVSTYRPTPNEASEAKSGLISAQASHASSNPAASTTAAAPTTNNDATASSNPYVPYYMQQPSGTSGNIPPLGRNSPDEVHDSNIQELLFARREMKSGSFDSHENKVPIRGINKRPSGVRAAQQQQQQLQLQQQQQQQQQQNQHLYGIASANQISPTSANNKNGITKNRSYDRDSYNLQYDDVYGAAHESEQHFDSYTISTGSVGRNQQGPAATQQPQQPPLAPPSSHINSTSNNNSTNATTSLPSVPTNTTAAHSKKSRFAEAYQQQYEDPTYPFEPSTNHSNTINNNSNSYYANNPYRAATTPVVSSSTGSSSSYREQSQQQQQMPPSISPATTIPMTMVSPPSAPSTLPAPRRKGRIGEGSSSNTLPMSPALSTATSSNMYSGATSTVLYSQHQQHSQQTQSLRPVSTSSMSLYSQQSASNTPQHQSQHQRSGSVYANVPAITNYNSDTSHGSTSSYYNNYHSAGEQSYPSTGNGSPHETRILRRVSQNQSSFYGQQYISALERTSSSSPVNHASNNPNGFFTSPNGIDISDSSYEYGNNTQYTNPQKQQTTPTPASAAAPVVKKKVRRIAEPTPVTPPSSGINRNSFSHAPTQHRPISGSFYPQTQSFSAANSNISNSGNGYDQQQQYQQQQEQQHYQSRSTHYYINTNTSGASDYYYDDSAGPSYAQQATYQPYSPMESSHDYSPNNGRTPTNQRTVHRTNSDHSEHGMWASMPVLQTLGQRFPTNPAEGMTPEYSGKQNNAMVSNKSSGRHPHAQNMGSSSQEHQSASYFAPAGYYPADR